MMGKFAYLWPFCPIFCIVFSAIRVQFWVVHLSKRTGGFISQPTVLELCFGPFLPSFSITDCRALFHQVLVLKHLFTGCKMFFTSINLEHFLQWALDFPLWGENIFAFSLMWGKFAFLWPFLTLFFIVFLLWISSWAKFCFFY